MPWVYFPNFSPTSQFMVYAEAVDTLKVVDPNHVKEVESANAKIKELQAEVERLKTHGADLTKQLEAEKANRVKADRNL